MSETTPKTGIFRMGPGSVDLTQVDKPSTKSAILRLIVICIIGVACGVLFLSRQQQASPTPQVVDPYSDSDLSTAQAAQTSLNTLFEFTDSHSIFARIDLSDFSTAKIEAESALADEDFYSATMLFDKTAAQMSKQLGSTFENQYAELLPKDKFDVLYRHNAELARKLQEQRAFIRNAFDTQEYSAYLTALRQLSEVSMTGLVNALTSVKQSAQENYSAGRTLTAAPLFADVLTLHPGDADARAFFRDAYYKSGDLYLSRSGIPFTYVQDSGQFVATFEVDPVILVHALSLDKLPENAHVNVDQKDLVIKTLSILDAVDYEILSSDDFEAATMLPDSEVAMDRLTFNAQGIGHTNTEHAEWVMVDGTAKLATFQRDEEGVQSLLILEPTAKAKADLRLAFVPERYLSLVNR